MFRNVGLALVLLSVCGCFGGSDSRDDVLPAPCPPSTDADLCASAGVECGAITAVDACGHSRDIASCGTCRPFASCIGNKCVSQPAETDAQLCARLGYQCGDAQAVDTAGVLRTVDCGSCDAGLTCDPDHHVCMSVDVPETDETFCGRLNAQCGMVTAADNLGQQRTVDCGTCGGALICDTVSRHCITNCVSETDQQFCARLAVECGIRTGRDNMGQDRTVDCGSCGSGLRCDSQRNVCVTDEVAETDAAFCMRLGANCGTVTARDNLGVERTVDCGSCPGHCDAVLHYCYYEPHESDADFCNRLRTECGTVSGMDNFGQPRTVDCGTCGAGLVCDKVSRRCVTL